jgi:alkylated DNA repair protein (DNA oxidative demethylase)
MTLDLLCPPAAVSDTIPPWREDIAVGAVLLRRYALDGMADLLTALAAVTAAAPFRHLATPGGYDMSVAMTNCGALGWVTDRHGYRYAPRDPASGLPWPAMPPAFARLAREAAAAAGFAGFEPDACLINRYAPGARMGLHQDKNERDMGQPIVTVSLGLPATFLFGGPRREDRAQRLPVTHGAVVAWGGPARLYFHGVLPVKDGHHPQLGPQRISLTFRKAG